MEAGMKAVIIGGGIGGLAPALAVLQWPSRG
jgi:glycine/D-amino acid oxidase-like deaminating enzyme